NTPQNRSFLRRIQSISRRKPRSSPAPRRLGIAHDETGSMEGQDVFLALNGRVFRLVSGSRGVRAVPHGMITVIQNTSNGGKRATHQPQF
ncbi:hypothetical protein CCHR01_19998, partial [Colletotrichum chrysophilum]